MCVLVHNTTTICTPWELLSRPHCFNTYFSFCDAIVIFPPPLLNVCKQPFSNWQRVQNCRYILLSITWQLVQTTKKETESRLKTERIKSIERLYIVYETRQQNYRQLQEIGRKSFHCATSFSGNQFDDAARLGIHEATFFSCQLLTTPASVQYIQEDL